MADRWPSEAQVNCAEMPGVLLRAGVVILGYMVYAALAITSPNSEQAEPEPRAVETVVGAGRGIWLASNCQSCHSLYGLGGHTGPDLTNVTERRQPGYVEAIVRTGMPGMPPFELEDADAAAVAAFLSQVSATGVYPPRSLRDPVFGERR